MLVGENGLVKRIGMKEDVEFNSSARRWLPPFPGGFERRVFIGTFSGNDRLNA